MTPRRGSECGPHTRLKPRTVGEQEGTDGLYLLIPVTGLISLIFFIFVENPCMVRGWSSRVRHRFMRLPTRILKVVTTPPTKVADD